ncbi:hypothetical protein QBC46DRAFT_366513 [Diplogelasinospora grovesii]|uniref:Uncharacterized protein n=1 Tax=Diplogelasinospora grovesii TaxID=303347 RepID=A0AAN6N2J5_9PEZI|nr:hypothetical protein QBC46DRAFT_366513 [Diplogelasinospora grovesii]
MATYRAIFPLEVLHDCPDATVDICFVHGKTRMLTYDYDAYVVRKSVTSINHLIDYATNLLKDLIDNRSSYNASSRPLIFITYSLSSLIYKEAILLSRNNPKQLREAGKRLKVIYFFEELPLLIAGIIMFKDPATLKGYDSYSIYANYKDIVKFSSAEDNGFKKLLKELIK